MVRLIKNSEKLPRLSPEIVRYIRGPVFDSYTDCPSVDSILLAQILVGELEEHGIIKKANSLLQDQIVEYIERFQFPSKNRY